MCLPTRVLVFPAPEGRDGAQAQGEGLQQLRYLQNAKGK